MGNDCARNCGALLLTPGQLMWQTAEQRFQTKHARRAPHPPVDFVSF